MVINLAGSVVTFTNLHLMFPRSRTLAVALLSQEDGDRPVGAHGLRSAVVFIVVVKLLGLQTPAAAAATKDVIEIPSRASPGT